jgi:chromosome segregation ATPase
VKSRVLPILNAIGCLVLTGVVVLQWQRERALGESVSKLKTELHAANDLADAETRRAAGLERDIAVLKESIEATQKAAEVSARLMEEKTTQTAGLETEISAAREQLKTWETAIAARDEKLRALDAELTASRKRLDEAIEKLKEASTR